MKKYGEPCDTIIVSKKSCMGVFEKNSGGVYFFEGGGLGRMSLCDQNSIEFCDVLFSSDRLVSRYGKRRPLMLGGTVLLW